jgi:glucose-6-phosphate isomerase
MIFDFNNIISENVKDRGISYSEIENSKEFLVEIKKRIKDKTNNDYYPLIMPLDMQKEIQEIKEYAVKIQENFDNFVVVGMGGSSLGNELLHYAINGIFYNENHARKYPKLYFFDNVDPESIKDAIDLLDMKKTVFNIITKSGTTSETMLNMLAIGTSLKKEGLSLKDHLIFTTDPEKGFLREMSKETGIKTFPIHPLLGGRFSVLSHAGLVSAAVTGVDIEALIEGALKELEDIKAKDVLRSQALLLPLFQYNLNKSGVNINVIFSYSDSLYYIGEWYKQLMAESLGKRYSREGKDIFAGITPLFLKGTTDQHSVLQLLIEGPFDKFIIFMAPKKFRKEIKVSEEIIRDERINYLQGREYSSLIKSEYIATKAALKKNGRPNVSIEFDKIDEFNLGRAIYMLEYGIIALGEMLNINPIDQPGVELGKKYTYGIMGRKGFEKERNEFKKLEKGDQRYIIE